jgi:hypothetical protein
MQENMGESISSGVSECKLDKFIEVVGDQFVKVGDKFLKSQDQFCQLLALMKSHETKIESHEKKIVAHETKIDTLEQEQKTQSEKLANLETFVHEKFALAERTQNDPYSAAFKNDDFLQVFLFLAVFGYDTTSGYTCAVFHEVNKAPCVCINFRSLHVMAKMLLNSKKKVLKKGLFPNFSLFRIGRLQELFKQANIPHRVLTKETVTELYNYTYVEPLKADRANLVNWIALDMKPFVYTVKTLIRSGKMNEFKQLFHENFPQDDEGTFLPQCKITNKDKVSLTYDADADESLPVFGQPYWDELFYDEMLTYRQCFFTKEDATEHVHFSSFYSLDKEEDIPRFETLSFSQGESTKKRKRDDEVEEGGERRSYGEKRPRFPLGRD